MSDFLLVASPRKGLIDGLPHGLLALSNYAQCKAPEHKVKIIDLGLRKFDASNTRLVERIRNANDLRSVCFSTTTATYQSALYLARVVKSERSDLTVVFGGPHATHQDEVILRNHEEVDCVIRGEGEKPFLSIMNQGPGNLWATVPSASYRRNGRVIRNEDGPLLSEKELSEVPFDLSNCEFCDSFGRDRRLSYVSARGCPRKCRFCAAGRTLFRSKSKERIASDVDYLVSEGYSILAFEDNDFLYSQHRAEAVCRILSDFKTRYSELDWDCQTRLEDLRDLAVIEELTQSGCSGVYFGLESFDERSLEFLGKTAHPCDYINDFISHTLPALLQNRLKISLNLQVGLPIEDKETRDANFKRLREVGEMASSCGRIIEICPMLHVLYPGTEEYQDYSRALRLPVDIFESFTTWEVGTSDERKMYRNFVSRTFAHGSGGIPVGILEQSGLRNAEFDLDLNRLQEVVDFIEKIKEINGLVVLDYSRYLSVNGVE